MSRKIITTRWHAFLDYMTALLLIISPWLFDFTEMDVSRTISVIAGSLILLMAIFTKNEGGLIRVLPMPVHLTVDVLLGIAMLIAPLILIQNMPHVLHIVVGLILICTGLYTRGAAEEYTTPVPIPEKDAHIQSNNPKI